MSLGDLGAVGSLGVGAAQVGHGHVVADAGFCFGPVLFEQCSAVGAVGAVDEGAVDRGEVGYQVPGEVMGILIDVGGAVLDGPVTGWFGAVFVDQPFPFEDALLERL